MIPRNKEPRNGIKQLSDEDLENYLAHTGYESSGRKLALHELARRRSKLKFSRLSLSIIALAAFLLVLLAITFLVQSS